MRRETLTVIANIADKGKRLDSFLHERLPAYSRSRLQSWIKNGSVLIDRQPARASHLIRGHETVELTPRELPPLKATAEDIALNILYEDSDVVVIDKPAGMVVHAGAGHHEGTLVNALLHHFGTLSRLNGDMRPGIVHRLDRDTSGVIVVARTDRAHQSLAAQFQKREVQKTYVALVHGRMNQLEGRIASPIARDPIRRIRMTAKLGSGRAALTEFKVLEQFEKLSYLEVRIYTGRTHQIRVHLSSIGHPVFGDRLYGAPAAPELNRFFLHAYRLRFTSPSSGKAIVVESQLPTELAGLLDSLADKKV